MDFFNCLPKDIIVKIALELKNPDMLNLACVNKKFHKYISMNRYLWIYKLLQDFPKEYTKEYTKEYKNEYKQEYKEKYKINNLNNCKRLYIVNAKNTEIRLKITMFNFFSEDGDVISDKIDLYELYSFYYGSDLKRIRSIIQKSLNCFINNLDLDLTISIKINKKLIYSDEIILKNFTEYIDYNTNSITVFLNSEEEINHIYTYDYEQSLEESITKYY